MDFIGVLSYGAFFTVMAGIYAIATLGLNIQWGYTGLFNVGIAASYAIGAYTSAILTKGLTHEHIGGFHFPIVLGWLGGSFMAGLAGFFIGVPTLRLTGDYLAMATLGIAATILLVIRNEPWLSGGVWGIKDIPQPFQGMVSPGNTLWLYLAIVIVVLVALYFFVERCIRSPWGRTLKAIREDEVAAAAIGKNVFSFKMQAFVFGSMIIGLAGAIYAHFIRYVSPDTFNPIMGTFIIWIMLTIGGRGNNKGAILGAFVVWAIWVGTEFFTNLLPTGLVTRAGFIRIIFISLLLEMSLLKRPQGLLGEEKEITGGTSTFSEKKTPL